MTRHEDAIRSAVDAVRAYQEHDAQPGRTLRYRGPSAADVLEAELGPLDWSIGGDGFRLLRQVAARVFPEKPIPGPPGERRPGDGFYDATAAARAATLRALARERW
jgi:hypothetical protein